MPTTVTTKEDFDRNTSRESLKKEIELRALAGAIRSKIIDRGNKWVIETEWNIVGKQ